MKTLKMAAHQLVQSKQEADAINKKASHGKAGNKNEMGKDAFMKLLITQLKYQDPTRPMEDREFISQMAQFSALEQMTNMNKEIISLARSTRSAEAFSLLGKQVDALNPATNRRVSGIVSSIQYKGDEQLLMVGTEGIRVADIHTVRNAEPAAPKNGVINSLQTNSINKTTDNRDVIQAK
jgi:flagellar basal-body rod modification protein FlgD